MGTAMVSPRRRQVIIGGLAAVVAPVAMSALPESPTKLVLSGRVIARDGRPFQGARIAAGNALASTDADGRFVLHATTRHYRVTGVDAFAEGFVAGAHADIDGTWRATFSITL